MDILYKDFTQTKSTMIENVQREITELNEKIHLTCRVLESLGTESTQRKNEVIDDLYQKAQSMKQAYSDIDNYERMIARLEDQLIFINGKQ